MELHAMGIGYRHDADFHISRPNGSGDWLLLIFRTAAFVTDGGVRSEVSRDSVVLYTKNAPQDYGANGGEYVNDWVHFGCGENDIFFERLDIPFNTPVPLQSAAAVENTLWQLKLESVSDTPKSRECCDLLLRLLIAQALSGGKNKPDHPYSESLRRIRAEIYGDPASSRTIEELAALVPLSPSYFQTLYRRQFGVSCYEDVLRAKTGLAKYYLENTAMSVKEIAGLCGFANDEHFMRQFRKRTGMTAIEWRRDSDRIS